MGKAEAQAEHVALGGGAVADPNQVQLAHEALTDPGDHVGQHGARRPGLGPGQRVLDNRGNLEDAVFLLYGDLGVHGVAELPLGALDRHGLAGDLDGDLGRNRHRSLCDS